MATGAGGTTTSRHPGIEFVDQLGRFADRVAVIDGERSISYGHLAERVAATAEELGSDRRLVALNGGNDLGTIVVHLAALAGRHPVLFASDDRHLQQLVRRFDPDVVARPEGSATRIHQRLDDPRSGLHDDLALVLSTSGSTGSTKCVRLSHANVQSNAAAIATYLGLRHDDRAITSLPLHYCYGLSVLHSHLLVGAAIVLSTASVVDPCFWRAVRAHGVTSLAGVPHTFELFDRAGPERLAAPSLRRLTQAGGRLPPDAVRRYAELGRTHGWDLFVMYGQTEATARMSYLPPGDASAHPDSIGVPIPGGAFRLDPTPASCDEAPGVGPGEVPVGAVGELVYSGPNVMMGYAAERADLARGPELTELRTGDLATRDADGRYSIVGRRSRFAKVFGLRLDLEGIERAMADEGITASCIDLDGRLGVALVGADPRRISDRIAEVAGIPRSAVRAVEVPELPRRSNGKVDLVAVAEAVRDGDVLADVLDVGAVAAVGVQDLYRTALGVEQVGPDDTFVRLGGDSLSYIEVSLGLERLLGHLPRDWHVRTVEDLESEGSPQRWQRRPSWLASWRAVETSVLLRAAAIVAVVGSHAGWFRLRGGAHLLLIVAGYNLARFMWPPGGGGLHAGSCRAIARVALPAAIWLAILMSRTDDYGWSSVVLLSSYLGEPGWSPAWRYWFVEALVLILVGVALLTSVPAVRRVDRRRPLLIPAGVLVVGLLLRFDLLRPVDSSEPLLVPHRVLWLVALGVVLARVGTWRGRAAASTVALVTVPGFFGEPSRDAVVVVGVLLVAWLPSVTVPAVVARLVGVLAGASLYVYLTHFQVYMPLQEAGVGAAASVAASLVVGVGAWAAVDAAGRLARSLRSACVAARDRRWGDAAHGGAILS
jgi:acyl-CoA synthetase (AMP-forming)/AMP-acid ligase II